MWPAENKAYAQSAVQSSVTGTVSKTNLATIALPPLGPNDRVEVWAEWSFTGATAKAISIDLGAGWSSPMFQQTGISNTMFTAIAGFQNRNSSASQVAIGSSFGGGTGGVNASPPTGTIDTSTSQNLLIQATLGNTGDSATLESYRVQIFRA